MTIDNILKFMQRVDALAFVSWGGLVWTIVGTLLGAWALYVTYMQARQAKDAAIDAKKASAKAVHSFQLRLNLSAIGAAVVQIEAIKELVNEKDFRAARISFHAIRRSVADVLEVVPSGQDEKLNIEKSIRTIIKQLDSASFGEHSPKISVRALSAVSAFLSKAESDLKYRFNEDEK